MNPIKGSLRYPAVTLSLTLGLLLAGTQAILHMPRMEDPSVTIRTGIVAAIYPGATSDQVESQVAKKMEDHLFKFGEVRKEKTYSTSRPGILFINVELQDSVRNSDEFWSKLRHDLNEAHAGGEFPPGVVGLIVDSDFGDTVAMLVAIHGSRYGYRELKDYVKRIEDELRTVPNVAKLRRYGEQKEQIWITGSLQRISQYFANPTQVVQALQQRNIIENSGALLIPGEDVPLKTSGLLATEEQIKKILVDVSRNTGQPVYIGDFASVERRYQDPDAVARFDGEASVLLSVEMQKGRNIVDLGEQISAALAQVRPLLPPDLKLDLIADQPSVVHERIQDLEREFLLAIGSVIVVTIILLPIRVAVIAATAIPVTVAATLGVLNAVGIPLHQVSIAGLIVSLGILVDDAIVIADNYVELLDHGVPRADAAWRSASEMAVPVLAATLTIIASFLPLITLSGSPGEFIRGLPLAVTIGLACSFAVAMLLTPLLCRFFIKKGLHSDEAAGGKKKFDILDFMQAAYNRAITFLMDRKWIAVGAGIAAVAAGVALFTTVPQQFFPSAERNQFVIDVWMPPVSRLEQTDSVTQRIRAFLLKKAVVKHVATFAGQSFPRFYYNVNPQEPDARYGQLIVITGSANETPALIKTLRSELPELAPEALVMVKELQQGSQIESPVEVRISGDDIPVLKTLGSQVEGILRESPIATYVRNDYYDDSWMVGVNVRAEEANRLGLTNASIAQQLAGAFSGSSVTTFWEGDRKMDVLLRLDADQRRSFDDVRNAYLTSTLTGQRVLLRSVAELKPAWQITRIVRRNGVRTLTVGGFATSGHYGSEILKAIDPKVKSIALPAGYRIAYGGEIYEQSITFGQMLVALGISLVCIFLVLLFQFRTISEPLVVMSAIPLSLFGAVMGLVVTGNPFGFTSFMGCIALSGIVVRNSIILVDYINEKRRAGSTLEEAALEAGERRLRPIFLTTMAAAVGVTPMILSHSSLWSPLASVLASGLVFSMFFVLLVVPVLFVIVEKRSNREPSRLAPLAAMVALCFAGTLHAQSPRKLTLPEAVDLALKQNSDLRIGRAKVRGNQYHAMGTRAEELPQVKTDAALFGIAKTQNLTIPAGALGAYPAFGLLPGSAVLINQGNHDLFITNTTVEQPLTQLIKLRAARRAAQADVKGSQADLRKTENEVALQVRRVYIEILIGRLELQAMGLQVSASEQSLKENTDDVSTGKLLAIAALRQKTNVLQSKYQLSRLENQISDLTGDLNDLTGLPIDTELELEPTSSEAEAPLLSLAAYREMGIHQNPEIQAAMEAAEKARQGVRIAKADYIPDIGAFAQYTYQNGVPFLVHNNGSVGLRMSWKVFDWGKRSAAIGQEEAQLTRDEENVQRVTRRVTLQVERSYRNLELAKEMTTTARAALEQARETRRLDGDRYVAGVNLASEDWRAKAGEASAQANLLRADLNYLLSKSELDAAIGAPPK
ncbi:MAG: AcrB/AcrD/AcrF family protein [Bryobacterales bacterium]|nr:AcrB/AcrD/AcrF family protein [Bryobacterales bacterium]